MEETWTAEILSNNFNEMVRWCLEQSLDLCDSKLGFCIQSIGLDRKMHKHGVPNVLTFANAKDAIHFKLRWQ